MLLNSKTISVEILKEIGFYRPILVLGEQGSGKTFIANKLAETLNIEPVRVNGHNSLETVDLLGYLMPYVPNSSETKATGIDFFSSNASKKQFIWKDGPLTEAIRRAGNGEKVILILDELLRIPPKELNILLSTLAPIDNKFYVRTGRIIDILNDVGVEEVISCPVENLLVFATSNIGSEFGISEIDSALQERFLIFEKNTNANDLTNIVKSEILSKFYNNVASEKSDLFVEKIIEFYENIKNLRVQEYIDILPTIRTIVQTIHYADSIEEVPVWFRKQALKWVKRDYKGKYDNESLKTIYLSIEIHIEKYISEFQ